ncbi:MAG: hypothetical protein NTV81_03775 [Candidatus Komeilibacteria bacterium]|nr:hypothetical protein [Candidatus Komeilibacteria bacterium]
MSINQENFQSLRQGDTIVIQGLRVPVTQVANGRVVAQMPGHPVTLAWDPHAGLVDVDEDGDSPWNNLQVHIERAL